ncbi:uncharacterized protein LOC127383113 [Apus apus]|uniref:uncharacterized protein LOC127383113 n=1 Tax=Apus apus TaxID=8895 RepID=UPI0021F8A5E1|nr:uncharacterized protein LOC127383113 [Apus apus]
MCRAGRGCGGFRGRLWGLLTKKTQVKTPCRRLPPAGHAWLGLKTFTFRLRGRAARREKSEAWSVLTPPARSAAGTGREWAAELGSGGRGGGLRGLSEIIPLVRGAGWTRGGPGVAALVAGISSCLLRLIVNFLSPSRMTPGQRNSCRTRNFKADLSLCSGSLCCGNMEEQFPETRLKLRTKRLRTGHAYNLSVQCILYFLQFTDILSHRLFNCV